MKRLMALVMAVLFVLFAAGIGFAAETDDITVTVTMTGVAISIGANDSWTLGTVTPSLDSVRQERTKVWNSGGILMDVTLQVTNPTTWKIKGGAAVAKDSFNLRGVFTHKDTTGVPEQDSFAVADSIISASAREATNTIYAYATGGSPAGASGMALAYNDTVALWLWFKAPTTSTVTAEQSITLTVGGKVAD